MLHRSKLSTDLVDLEVHQEDLSVEEGGLEQQVVDLVLEAAVVLEELVEVVEVELAVLDQQVMLEELVVLVVQDLWRKPSLEYQEMITQSLVMYQRPPSFVMGRWMEVIMLIQKRNVKHSTSVPMMEMED